MDSEKPPENPDDAMAGVVERNIKALMAHNEKAERERSLEQRAADAITRFAGSMLFVYIHVILFGLWIVINLGWVPLPRFDPTFVILAMASSVEAIFLSTFILITQNRMAAISQRRADLDLQISLLAEHETTKVLTLVKDIALKMQVREAQNPELTELQKDVNPEKVLNVLEKHEPGP